MSDILYVLNFLCKRIHAKIETPITGTHRTRIIPTIITMTKPPFLCSSFVSSLCQIVECFFNWLYRLTNPVRFFDPLSFGTVSSSLRSHRRLCYAFVLPSIRIGRVSCYHFGNRNTLTMYGSNNRFLSDFVVNIKYLLYQNHICNILTKKTSHTTVTCLPLHAYHIALDTIEHYLTEQFLP